jgi:hypothetical protein
MSKPGPLARPQSFPPACRSKPALPTNPTQRQHYPHLTEQLELGLEIYPATIQLLPGGPVLGRRAAGRGRDVAVAQSQLVAAGSRSRLVGPAIPMQCGVQPVAAGVSGEGAAGPVAPVSAGCQSYDQQTRVGIAEAGNRPTPVLLVRKLPSPRLSDPAAVVTQPGAELAGGDAIIERIEVGEQMIS